MQATSLIFILFCMKLWMVKSATSGLLEDAEKSDVSAVRLRLEEEKEKRILLNNDVEVLMLKVARLERQMTQVLQNNKEVYGYLLRSPWRMILHQRTSQENQVQTRSLENMQQAEVSCVVNVSERIAGPKTKICMTHLKTSNTEAKGNVTMTASEGLTSVNRSQCPSNYTLHTPLHLCFRLSHEKQTIDTARHICESEGGHLAKVNSTEIWLYLQEQIGNSRYIPKQSHVYIGGNDKEEEGVWRWHDRELINVKRPLWGFFQPRGGASRNYLVMNGYANYEFYDTDGSELFHYICQV